MLGVIFTSLFQVTVASVPASYVTYDAIENNCPKKQRVRRFQPTGLPISLVLFWRQYRWTAVLLHRWGHRYSTGASPRRWKISPVLHRQTVISTSAPPRCTGGPAAKFCRWSTGGAPVVNRWTIIKIWKYKYKFDGGPPVEHRWKHIPIVEHRCEFSSTAGATVLHRYRHRWTTIFFFKFWWWSTG